MHSAIHKNGPARVRINVQAFSTSRDTLTKLIECPKDAKVALKLGNGYHWRKNVVPHCEDVGKLNWISWRRFIGIDLLVFVG
jgi:hypothetical protein